MRAARKTGHALAASAAPFARIAAPMSVEWIERRYIRDEASDERAAECAHSQAQAKANTGQHQVLGNNHAKEIRRPCSNHLSHSDFPCPLTR